MPAAVLDFVVWPYVLDTWVNKRGAKLSTDRHLLDLLAGQAQMYSEGLLGTSGSALRKSFTQIPSEAAAIESEWTLFSASIADVAAFELWT